MRRVVLVLVAVVGAALAGTGVWFSADRHPATFGWTAYAPSSGGTYTPYLGPSAWSIALIVLGSVVAASALTLLVVGPRRG